MRNKQPSVFEVYAHEYDLITNAAAREKNHRKEVRAMIKRFHPSRVLDAGCATGLTTLLFAREGVEAVGLDRSRKMIEVAEQSRGTRNLPMSFRQGRFEALPKNMAESFDLAACLANSISGVETIALLNKTMKNFFGVLKPGGHLVLQMLNYAAVDEHTLKPIKATENGGIVYERFNERQGKSLYIYVTRADFNQEPAKFEVFRHRFENFEPEKVERAVDKAGFKDIRKFGDLKFEKRFGKKARDLVLTARKPAK